MPYLLHKIGLIPPTSSAMLHTPALEQSHTRAQVRRPLQGFLVYLLHEIGWATPIPALGWSGIPRTPGQHTMAQVGRRPLPRGLSIPNISTELGYPRRL
jgi:hypothetical protein